MEREKREIIERDGRWFAGWSLEVPGANGQGRTVEECRESIAAAIKLIVKDKKTETRQGEL